MTKLNNLERKLVATILSHVEKNCSEVEEVEDYLWKMLDKDTDME
ncbi:hypothetical protein PQ478_09015 [Alkalihalophilus pseudofirmus]|nr:hypothetical protein [Alkalihalophilus pseudofirmus]WEG18611.1 hypothetical protein PQ478_09015 [Alkalihalophilus pseudofirmus]